MMIVTRFPITITFIFFFCTTAFGQRAKLALLLDGDIKSSFGKSEQTKVPLTGTVGLSFGSGDVDIEAKVVIASAVDTVIGSDTHTFGNAMLLPESQSSHLSGFFDLLIHNRENDQFNSGVHISIISADGEWQLRGRTSQEINVISGSFAYTLSWDTHEEDIYGGWIAEAGITIRTFAGDIQSDGSTIKSYLGSSANFFWGPYVGFQFHYNALKAFLQFPYFISGSDDAFVNGLSKIRFRVGIGVQAFVPLIKLN